MKKHSFRTILFALILPLSAITQTITDNIGSDFQYIVDDGSSNPMAIESTVWGPTERIWLTDQDSIKGGSVPTDIFYDNNTDKVFIYGKRNITVYDAPTNTLSDRIQLEYDDLASGESQIDLAQFYPVIEESQNLNDNHFAYKPGTGSGTLYCVSETFNVYSINTNTLNCQLIIPASPNSMNSQYYNTFIKYHNNRLYLAFTSSILSLKSEFYVYDTDNNYDLIGHLTFENSNGTDQIRGMEINTATGANEFFLSLNDAFYSFTYNPNFDIDENNVMQTLIYSYAVDSTAGNLLYVNEAGMHKLFCFPNGGIGTQYFYVKDLSSGGTDYTGQCPANITSACFNGSDKVFMSYKSTAGNTDLRTISAINYGTLDSDSSISGVNDINTRTVDGQNYTLDMEILDGQLILTKESEVILFDPIDLEVDEEPLHQGKNNYFSRVVVNNNLAYVIGTWSTELDVFTTSGQFGTSTELGGIVFKACHNPNQNKIYFYNTHVQDNSKIYILNTTDNSIDMLELDSSIADIEIDPTTNNALVSTGDASNNIKVISGNTNLLINPLDLGNYGHIGEMFVSSNNLLYCIIMENGTNQPGIIVWDLSQAGNNPIDFHDYNTGGSPIRGYFSPHNSVGQNASYDYVYAVINIPGTTNAPFASRFRDDQYDPQLVKDINLPQGNYIDIVHYDKYVYVAKQGAERTVVLLDQSRWLVNGTLDMDSGGNITDLEVNPDKALVYVLHGSLVSKISGNNLLINRIIGLNSHTNSLQYNKESQRLYVYLPFGCVGCGNGSGGIYDVFDDEAQGEGWLFYPDNDTPRKRYTNNSYAPLHHDMIIDNTTNKIYYGSGGNSCINMVDIENTYVLLLRQDKDVTWLSIPRHYHTGGTVLPNSTPTSTVFGQNTIDEQYSILDLDYSLITGSNGNYTPIPVNAHWEFQPNWTYTTPYGDMYDIISLRGYILELNPNWTGNNFLHLNGTIEDPNTSITLYCGEENWVGYFIPEVQDVFDALGDQLGNLNVIKHQDWTCARTISVALCFGTKSTLGTSPQDWTCSGRHNVKFGDMLMLTPVHDATMTWNWTGNPPSEAERPEATYYVPEEQATYTTMSIELDTTSNPQEIGAFVNDSCVGSCSVLPEDTIVVMQAYLGEQPGDSVTFKEHYASRDINEREIKEYRVLNFENMLKEERTIKTGEGEPLIVVSFKNGKTKEEQPNEAEIGFVVYPNPTKGKINFSLNVEEEVKLIISIFSINGKLVSKPLEQTLEPGFVTSSIKLLDNSGNELKPGIYILRANIGKVTEIKKLIIE